MNPQLLYQEDVTRLEFEATAEEKLNLPDGRTGVILDRTYFYPTGGGQEHDTGWIGEARVVEVYKGEATPRLVHVVEGQVESGLVRARIDAERRLRHMQHHTAQHLLTQCILRLHGYETVSANINGYTPSTLDIVAPDISKAQLDEAETLANQLIYEDRVVKTYLVTPQELQTIPLRRPPKVTEDIRIVEIDAYDYSPCGGTHVPRTGQIGVLKVIKAERQNDKMRVHFIAGMQALETFRHMYDALVGLAGQMTIGWQDVPGIVERQAEALSAAQKELQVLRQESLRFEALELAASAEARHASRLVRASFDHRAVSELRLLADELRKVPGLVAMLATYDGQKISLIVTCAEGSGLDARQILSKQLTGIGGRGGGDAKLAQGGGAATPDQFSLFLECVEID
jgi:alanyl-tRNA synthetase